MIANAYELAIQAVEELDVNEQTDLLLQNLFEEMERVGSWQVDPVMNQGHVRGSALDRAIEYVTMTNGKSVLTESRRSPWHSASSGA